MIYSPCFDGGGGKIRENRKMMLTCLQGLVEEAEMETK
jgi:hypothetical protein